MDEADNFMNSIFQMDEWLCDDEFDKTADVYTSKLDSLKEVGNIYETRCREDSARGVALTGMRKTLNIIQLWLAEGCKTEEFSHIEESVLTELQQKTEEANAWLDERQQLSSNSAKNIDPPFFAEEVVLKSKEINNAYYAVRVTPKPDPKKEEKEEKTEEEQEPKDVKMEDTEKLDEKSAENADVEMEN